MGVSSVGRAEEEESRRQRKVCLKRCADCVRLGRSLTIPGTGVSDSGSPSAAVHVRPGRLHGGRANEGVVTS